MLVTVNPDGSATTQVDSSQPAYDLQEDVLVGVVNTSGAYVASIALSGADSFGFDGDGLCTESGHPAGCPFGPTGYEGPGTSLTATDASDGSVSFAGQGLAPGASAYFSLEEKATAGAVTLASALTGAPRTVSAVEGNAFSNQPVAGFTDADPTATATEFTATINWGDASTSPGVVTGPTGGPFVVSGSHLYAEEGSHTVTVQVTDSALAVNSVTVLSTANVSDAPLSGSASSLVATTGVATGTVQVAKFTDGNPTAPLSDFSATINWGDASTSVGTVSGPLSGVFSVSGAHTYAAHGTYTVTVTVHDVGGASVILTGSAMVSDAVISCPAGKSCTSTVTVPNKMSTQVVGTSSTNGQIFLSVGLDTLSCGDPYDHAPEVSTITESDYTSPIGKVIFLTIDKSVVAKFANPRLTNFRICYSSPTPFKDIYGHTVTTGLLPYCVANRFQTPCDLLTYFDLKGNVVEVFDAPSGDPKFW